MIRLSVTALESLRWNRILDQGLEELIADLTYSRPKTAKMMAGGALAKFLEHTPASNAPISSVMRDGWTFDFSELDAELPAPGVTELKARVMLDCPGGQVLLTGKADGVSGLELRDQKLSEKFEPENYVDSLQWRSYLWMLGARRFTYDVFVGRINETEKTVVVREYHPVAFYSYPGIERSVMAAVDELAAIIRRYRQSHKALADMFPELPDQDAA